MRGEFFTLPPEDAPADVAPVANEVDPGTAGALPEGYKVTPILPLDAEGRDALRADIGETSYVGVKPLTKVRSPSSDPTGSVFVEGMEIPIGSAGFSRAGKRPRHN